MTIEQASAVNTIWRFLTGEDSLTGQPITHADLANAMRPLAKAASKTLGAGVSEDRIDVTVIAVPTRRDCDLALWFTPGAIRDHFDGDACSDDGDDEDVQAAKWVVDEATDEQLRSVGSYALEGDGLYREFHEQLGYGVEAVRAEAKVKA